MESPAVVLHGSDEIRKQKHDRRDAPLAPQLLVEVPFRAIWLPSTEQQDLCAHRFKIIYFTKAELL